MTEKNENVAAESGEGWLFWAKIASGFILFVIFTLLLIRLYGYVAQPKAPTATVNSTHQSRCPDGRIITLKKEPISVENPRGCRIEFDITPSTCLAFAPNGVNWRTECATGEEWDHIPNLSFISFKLASENSTPMVSINYKPL